MTPSFSVVIPCFNLGQFVGQAIDSVLRQEHVDFECIVVDDGSTDSSLETISRYSADPRVRVIAQRNVGYATAHNTGLRNARGRYVALLDADDYWIRTDVLARWQRIFDEDARVAVVYSDVMTVDESGETIDPHLHALQKHPSGDVMLDMFQHNFVYLGAGATRLSLANEIGGFDTSIPAMLDYSFWLRLSARGGFAYCPTVVLAYRQRRGSASKNYLAMAEATYRTHWQFARTLGDRLPRTLVDDVLASDLLGMARAAAAIGMRHQALVRWCQSLALRSKHPLLMLEPRFWLALGGPVLGTDVVAVAKTAGKRLFRVRR